MTQNYIHEQERNIPVTGDYDVIVIGGGMAGVSAALAAARHGQKAALAEKMYGLGGLATLGLITIYLPLCDGRGTQVTFGQAEEFLRMSLRYGCESRYPEAWLESGKEFLREKQRFEVQYNGPLFSILMEEELKKAGVNILYGTMLCSATTDKDKIDAVIVENTSGRQALKAKFFIDATGDAALCYLAGEDTSVYSPGNPLSAWYCDVKDGEYNLRIRGTADIVRENQEVEHISTTRYTGIDGQEISDMVCDSHHHVLEDFLAGGESSKKYALATLPSIPQLRMTRKLCGPTNLDDTDSFRHFDDSIGMVGDWRKRGPIYEIPFSALRGRKYENLLAAGRCISVSDAMWDITRVIPACVLTGEACGTAAALCDSLKELDIHKLQEELTAGKVKLHLEDIGKNAVK